MIRFLVKAGLFYIIWQVVYDLIIYPDGRLDQFLATSVAILAKNGLALFGWDINAWDRLLVIDGYRGVVVLNECNALTLMSLYSGFIVAFQGPNKKRIIYLLSGIGIIFILNVIRIMAFSLATVYFQHYWDIFHEFSSFIFFYPVILGIWYQWTLLSEESTQSQSEFSVA
jgi:exosortase/archaeosortase family protein